jgi:hypothetical protein
MKAEVGDRIVVASGTLHRPIRDGEILQIGEEGGGPYLVRWSDGNESLFFPGPDAHVEHVSQEPGDGADQQAGAAESRPQPTKQWSVDIYLYEDENATAANAVCPARSTSTARLTVVRPIPTCRRLATK